ncbi:MAG: protein kinase domain-containing protein [Stenotrophomonas sp.]
MESTAEDWLRREALLDTLLDLPEPERAGFIARVAASNADDAAALRGWLAGIERSADYLLPKGQAEAIGHAGELVGNWRALQMIGRGGMGEVWLGERADGLFERKVAIKFIRDDRPALARNIESERQVLAGLQHPGIVRLLDAGTLAEGQPYLVTDLIEGRTLDAWLQHAQPGIDVRLDLFVQVAQAVAYAHERLVIHRDIKPGNILVDAQDRAHLLDFGIARVLAHDQADAAGATQVALTPEFAAPELIIDNSASVRSDVYALGGLLYYLLCGRAPLELGGLALGAMVARIRDELPPAPAAQGVAALAGSSRALLDDLDAIALKALAKRPEDRYGSVDALLADVAAARAQRPIVARTADWRDRCRRYLYRHRIGVSVVSLLLLILVAGLVGTLWQAHEARLQQQRAEAEARRATQQANTAGAVRDFLIGVFEAANPELTGGKTPTALELVDAGVRQAETTLAGQPEMQARLFDALARTYIGLGEYAKAEALSKRGYDAAVTALGEEAPLALELAITHARTVGQGDGPDESAAQMIENILTKPVPAAPGSGRQRGIAAYQLATLRKRAGQLDEAERWFTYSVKQLQALGVQGEMPLAEALHQYAGLDEAKGSRVDAIAHLRQSLALNERQRPQPMSELNMVREDLANLLSATGDTAGAVALLRQVVDDNRALYGPVHQRSLTSAAWLGRALVKRNEFAEADALLTQTLAAARAQYGDDAEPTAAATVALAASKLSQGDVDAAIELSEASHRYAVANGGPDSFRAIITTQNGARLHMFKGDYAATERIAREVLASLERIGSANTNDALELIGDSLSYRGDAAGALAMHQQALDVLAGNGDDSSIDVQMLKLSLAENERDLGEMTLARQHAAEALAGLQALGQTDKDDLVVSTRFLQAEFDLLQGNCTAPGAIEAQVAQYAAKPGLSPLAQWRAAYAGLLLGMCQRQQGTGGNGATALIQRNARALLESSIASPQAKQVARQAQQSR